MKDTNTLILVILGATVMGGVGFFAGRHSFLGFGDRWTKGQIQAFAPMSLGGRGMMGGGSWGKGAKAGGAYGEITKVEGTTLTVKISDDTTKEITLSDEAQVNLMNKGTLNDLQVGQTVMIGGGFWGEAQTVVVKAQ